MKRLLYKFHAPDLMFFSVVMLLAALGLVMVYSSSSVVALDRFGDSAFYLKRQLLFMCTGFVGMCIVMSSDYREWVKRGGWILLGCLLSLVLVLIPGVGLRAGGAQRWLAFGGIHVQPGEFVKLGLVLYLTWALVRKGHNARSFTRGMLPLGIVTGVLSALLLYQPDFGNAVMLTCIGGVMIYLAGARISYLMGIAIGLAPLVYAVMMGEGYRRKRVLAFLDPWQDPGSLSYQIVQSFMAFFSGGFWGAGLGNSQEKLNYLPKVHTDFIGAVLAEELGYVGVLALISCYVFLAIRGLRIASRAPDPSGFLLAAGCTSLIALQAALNLCVIMGLLPTKGMPLPFLSHGGSATMVVFLACGFIQSVAAHSEKTSSNAQPTWFKHWGT